MVDLVITAASVVSGSDAQKTEGTAGEAITAGQLIYKDSTTSKWMKADADSATVAARLPAGIALNGAGLNQPVDVQTSGDITPGATLVANTAYFLSGTAGGICPLADVGTGEYLVLVGIAKTAAVMKMAIVATGVAN